MGKSIYIYRLVNTCKSCIFMSNCRHLKENKHLKKTFEKTYYEYFLATVGQHSGIVIYKNQGQIICTILARSYISTHCSGRDTITASWANAEILTQIVWFQKNLYPVPHGILRGRGSQQPNIYKGKYEA